MNLKEILQKAKYSQFWIIVMLLFSTAGTFALCHLLILVGSYTSLAHNKQFTLLSLLLGLCLTTMNIITALISFAVGERRNNT